eukprot:7197213-Pyramimonas_sp.AAC.1
MHGVHDDFKTLAQTNEVFETPSSINYKGITDLSALTFQDGLTCAAAVAAAIIHIGHTISNFFRCCSPTRDLPTCARESKRLGSTHPRLVGNTDVYIKPFFNWLTALDFVCPRPVQVLAYTELLYTYAR